MPAAPGSASRRCFASAAIPTEITQVTIQYYLKSKQRSRDTEESKNTYLGRGRAEPVEDLGRATVARRRLVHRPGGPVRCARRLRRGAIGQLGGGRLARPGPFGRRRRAFAALSLGGRRSASKEPKFMLRPRTQPRNLPGSAGQNKEFPRGIREIDTYLGLLPSIATAAFAALCDSKRGVWVASAQGREGRRSSRCVGVGRYGGQQQQSTGQPWW